MGTVNRPYGRVLRGNRIPYGTFANASYELKQAYYAYGYLNDSDLPDLPVWEPDDMVVDPEEAAIAQELARTIREMLDSLTPREAKVLRMRFGIDTAGDLTLDEIGQVFDVTRERIRQIEVKALRKLRHPYRRDSLYLFLDGSEVNLKAHTRREAVVKYYQHKAAQGW